MLTFRTISLAATLVAIAVSPTALADGDAPRVPSPDRAAIVLIEFQNEWLADDGKLRHLMRDEAIFLSAIEAGRDALEIARAEGLPVFHVGLRFEHGYPEFRPAQHGLRAAIPKVRTWLAGTTGAEFHPDFAPRPHEYVVTGRNGASGFSGSDLGEALRERGIETLYLAGFTLHVCVESTLRDAHDLGYAPVLLEEATAAFTSEQQQHVLEHVVHHFGEAIDNETFGRRVAARSVNAPPSRGASEEQ